MEDMYHCCRWCKHYEDGNCTRENFYVVDEYGCNVPEEIKLEIKEPESFYCSNWE